MLSLYGPGSPLATIRLEVAFVFTDAYTLINAVDLSNDVQQLSIDIGAELVDNTVMGNAARSNLPGLLTGGAQVTFAQDFAAGQVDATIFPLIGTTFAVEFRPTNAARAATNPAFTNTMTIPDGGYRPMGNSVGDFATAGLNLANASTTGFQRQTA